MPLKNRTDKASRDFVDALARGLDVLLTCADASEGLTLAEVARRTDTTRASARRSLLTLVAKGYLVSDGRLFSLTPKVLALAAPMISAPLTRNVQPVLDELSNRFDESFSVAVLSGSDIIYLARAEARRIVSLNLGPGTRLPAWCTSLGRVLLADLPPADWACLIPPVLAQRTATTKTDRTLLMQELRRVAEDGYSILDEELEPGLRSLAVPIRRQGGQVVAALNVGTQSHRTSRDDLEKVFLPALKQAADIIAPAFY
ncbi:helix-turn-helix domain-containing protein [Acetobacter sacchari]|uniref:Helix-turn-helix domain-containing protein n=1 Tax=Acetobacter sacchari TaxID=2661687 RepID=A0ABS3LW15_9PROT|nr:helix-turn-helix domain-containing protein [Acetobacter sacchari]